MSHPVFGARLRSWRRSRGLSQRDLSIRADVSERHISFLENGRSRPKSEMIERLCSALDLPLRERNELHISAGLTPFYQEGGEDTEDLAPFHFAIRRLLDNHHPYPAFVFNRWWEVTDANAVGRTMLPPLEEGGVNSVELTLHPDSPQRKLIRNFNEIAWSFYGRLRNEAFASPEDQKLQHLYQQATKYMSNVPEVTSEVQNELWTSPIFLLPNGEELHTVTMVAKFGSAKEIGMNELRVELMYPTDEIGERYFQTLAS